MRRGGVWHVEGRDAAKCSAIHRTAPTSTVPRLRNSGWDRPTAQDQGHQEETMEAYPEKARTTEEEPSMAEKGGGVSSIPSFLLAGRKM